MSFSSDAQTDFNAILAVNGTPYSAQNGSLVFTAGGYDDQTTWTASGATITGSCLVFPIDGKGGSDAKYIEQGIIKLEDLKAYLPSGAQVLSNAEFVVQGGSYWIVTQYDQKIENTLIYRKIYLRSRVNV